MFNIRQDMQFIFHPSHLCCNIAPTMVGLRDKIRRNEVIKAIAFAVFACSSLVLIGAGFVATTHAMGTQLTLTVIGIMALAIIGIAASVKNFLDYRMLNLKTASWLADFSLICKGQFDQAFQAFRARSLYVENYLNYYYEASRGVEGKDRSKIEGFVAFDPRITNPHDDGCLFQHVFGTALMMLTLKRIQNNPQINQEEKVINLETLKIARKCFRHQRCGIREYQEKLLDAIEANENLERLSQIPMPNKISPAHGFILEIIFGITNANADGNTDFIPNYINNLKVAKSHLQNSGEWSPLDEELMVPMLAAKTRKQIIDAASAISENQKLALINRFVTYENVPSNEELNQFILTGLQ